MISYLYILITLQLPSGPAYLDLEDLNEGSYALLMAVHASDSWIQSGFGKFKRFLGL